MPIAARTGTPCLPQIADAIASTGVLCSGQAGFQLWYAATPLTTAQLTTVCLSSTCLQLTKELQQIQGKDECVTTDSFFLYQDIFNPILKQCGEAKVETPTLPPHSSGGKDTQSSASHHSMRVTTLAVTAFAVGPLVLMI